MWARLSLKTKLTFLVVSIVSISTYSFGRFMFKGLTDLLDKVVGLRAETVAEAFVDMVDGNWFSSLPPNLAEDPTFKRLNQRILKLESKGYVDRVEMVRITGKETVSYVLSLPTDGSPDYHPPGTPDKILPGGLYSQKSGHYGVDLSNGTYMAGLIPVMNNGEMVGLLVVYIDIRDTQSALDAVQLALLITLVAFTVLSGLTAYKFAAGFEKTAVTDGLMGIYNHKYFKQRLEEETAKSRRYKQQTSLVLLDIDYFKRVNDTYGHATGDIVLKNLAKWVLENSRNTDVVARYGGEEITVVLPHTSVAGAQEFAERLRIKVSQQVVRDPEENAEFRVTVSIGVAQWEQGMSALDLIKRADAALYHSKHMGRNRVTIYQEDILPAPEPQPAVKSKG